MSFKTLKIIFFYWFFFNLPCVLIKGFYQAVWSSVFYWQVCTKGKAHIMKYLQREADRNNALLYDTEMKWNSRKSFPQPVVWVINYSILNYSVNAIVSNQLYFHFCLSTHNTLKYYDLYFASFHILCISYSLWGGTCNMFFALFQYMILCFTKYQSNTWFTSLFYPFTPFFLTANTYLWKKQKKKNLQNVRYAAFLLIIKEHTRLQLNKNLSTSSAF